MKRFGGIDRITVGLVLLLQSAGLLFIYSASYRSDLPYDVSKFVVQQGIWVALGWAAFGIVTIPHHRRYAEWAWWIYGAGILALAGLFVAGTTVKGATRWYRIGPIGLQPSEFMKIAFVLLLARCLRQPKDLDRWKGLLLPVVIFALPVGLILKQPDLGTALCFIPPLAVGIYLAGTRLRHLIVPAVAGLLLLPPAWFLGLRDYQRDRIETFVKVLVGSERLTPRELRGSAWQSYQSVLAVGSGRVTGRGFLHGTQNRLDFVPESSNDFIFTVVAEESGFVGGAALLLLYTALLLRLLWIAGACGDPFGRIVVAGIASILAFQQTINVGMTIVLFPVTGMPWPLVGYGGSSMLATMIAVGLCTNVAVRPVRSLGRDPHET